MSIFYAPRTRLAQLLAPLDAAMARYPAAGAALLAMTKATAVDVSIQSLVEKRKIDWRRTAVFAAHGFLWGGAGQWVLYNRIFPRVFSAAWSSGRKMNWKTVVQCVMADSLLHMPFIYMPLFYIIREAAPGEGTLTDQTCNGLKSWRENLVEDTMYQVSIFVPVQMWNFAYNPPHWRVPFVLSAGIVWLSLLSTIRGPQPSQSISPDEHERPASWQKCYIERQLELQNSANIGEWSPRCSYV
uniref:Peroxisomal membrane protein MPV17 n=1 Tax=Octactis speculum TaxID=3111310 RepID=A0A7S2D3H0_9STRA|mmetsp:Transcript_4302/g.5093  ORF Transcript_4302/g.5093 Transcript_4302/m.5093 type:complete len:242 (+) Transcript_4302:46-771(+)